MRTIVVGRRRLTEAPIALPQDQAVHQAWVESMFDAHDLPDGFPFVVDDDGT